MVEKYVLETIVNISNSSLHELMSQPQTRTGDRSFIIFHVN